MAEYAPQAIYGLFDALTLSGKVLSGIQGDSGHTFGYHRGRDYVSPTDYSVQCAADKQGDGEAVSALDVSGIDMRAVSAHLMAGMQARDPALRAVREFFGTLDGTTVTGWDALNGGYTTSDDSHLWHVHLSFYRQYANDEATLLDVADFLNGLAPLGGGTPIGDDMPVSDLATATFQFEDLGTLTIPQMLAEIRKHCFGPNDPIDFPVFGKLTLADFLAEIRKYESVDVGSLAAQVAQALPAGGATVAELQAALTTVLGSTTLTLTPKAGT